MRYTAERTATNVLVVTLHDMAYGIWAADGRVIAIPEGFPPRLISSTFPIRKVREKFAGEIRPGDVYLTNSPQDGAVHLPDWVFIKPVFYEDELVFFTCMGTHVADNGGAQAGTHFLAFDSIAEGLNIPLNQDCGERRATGGRAGVAAGQQSYAGDDAPGACFPHGQYGRGRAAADRAVG